MNYQEGELFRQQIEVGYLNGTGKLRTVVTETVEKIDPSLDLAISAIGRERFMYRLNRRLGIFTTLTGLSAVVIGAISAIETVTTGSAGKTELIILDAALVTGGFLVSMLGVEMYDRNALEYQKSSEIAKSIRLFQSNSAALPPVFKDRISPDEAPASINSATAEGARLRQQAVAAQYARRYLEISRFLLNAGAQPLPQDMENHVIFADQAVEVASRRAGQAAMSENVVPESGFNKFGFFRRFSGKQTETEQKNAITEASEALVWAMARRARVQDALGASEMYNKEYLADQSNEYKYRVLQGANSRGGSLVISDNMAQALKAQDQIQDQIRREMREH